MPVIAHVSTLDMPYHYSTDEIVAKADELWLSKLEDKTRRLAIKLFEGAKINSRSSVAPIETVFADLSFKQKNDLYIEAMIGQGKKLLQKFFAESGVSPQEIDILITTSCTGFMIPSVDAHLVDHFGMRQDILRLPVTEMGCAGGTSGLIYAHDLLQGRSHGKALVVSLEFPGLTFQKGDLSPENLVSTAIFADGAACVLVEKAASKNQKPRLKIKNHSMYHFPKGTHLMGFQLINSGLKIILDKEVPVAIEEHFPKILLPFLERQGIEMQDVAHFLFHPGGKKIIAQAEQFLARWQKSIPLSHQVLSQRGNMSSATVLHILELYWREASLAPPVGEHSLMLAFGPGFMAQQLLLQWQN